MAALARVSLQDNSFVSVRSVRSVRMESSGTKPFVRLIAQALKGALDAIDGKWAEWCTMDVGVSIEFMCLPKEFRSAFLLGA